MHTETTSSIEDLLSLNGRDYATLNDIEQETFEFFMERNGQYAVRIAVLNSAPAALLDAATTADEYDATRAAHSNIVHVTQAESAGTVVSPSDSGASFEMPCLKEANDYVFTLHDIVGVTRRLNRKRDGLVQFTIQEARRLVEATERVLRVAGLTQYGLNYATVSGRLLWSPEVIRLAAEGWSHVDGALSQAASAICEAAKDSEEYKSIAVFLTPELWADIALLCVEIPASYGALGHNVPEAWLRSVRRDIPFAIPSLAITESVTCLGVDIGFAPKLSSEAICIGTKDDEFGVDLLDGLEPHVIAQLLNEAMAQMVAGPDYLAPDQANDVIARAIAEVMTRNAAGEFENLFAAPITSLVAHACTIVFSWRRLRADEPERFMRSRIVMLAYEGFKGLSIDYDRLANVDYYGAVLSAAVFAMVDADARTFLMVDETWGLAEPTEPLLGFGRGQVGFMAGVASSLRGFLGRDERKVDIKTQHQTRVEHRDKVLAKLPSHRRDNRRAR